MNTNRKLKNINKKLNQIASKKTTKRPQNNAPRKNRPQGRGKTSLVGQALRGLGGIVGGAFGQPALGALAGAGISRIFGQGDYMVNSPGSNSLFSGGPPAFAAMNSGFRIRHREYVTDVTSSTNFNLTSYPINPGMTQLFPWLSTVAANFEAYKIHGLVVFLNSNSAVAVSSTNTALGVWGAVTQYDAADAPFVTKQQCENYMGCQAAAPCQSILHGIECKPGSNVLENYYVRTGVLPADADIKFYDVGTFNYFSQGSQASSTVGELWVSYDIEFFKPRVGTASSLVQSDYYYIPPSALASSANPLGTINQAPWAGSNLNSTLSGSANSITIPANAPIGNYYLVTFWNQASASTVAPTWAFAGSVSGWNLMRGGFVTQYNKPSSAATSTHAVNLCAFKKTSNSQGILTLQNATLGTNPDIDILLLRVTTTFGGILASVMNRLSTGDVMDLKDLLLKFKSQKGLKAFLRRIEELPEDEDDRPEDILRRMPEDRSSVDVIGEF